MVEIFNKNGDLDLGIPLHQNAMPELEKLKNVDNKQTKMYLIRKRFKQKKEKSEMYSLWCECLYRLSIANHVSFLL